MHVPKEKQAEESRSRTSAPGLSQPRTGLARWQEAAGNAAVHQTLTTRPDLAAVTGVPVQRAWGVRKEPVKPGSDAEFDSSAVPEAELTLLENAADMIDSIVSEAKGETLLYLGIGTGNPGAAWGNPTLGGDNKPVDADDQRSPGFLGDASGKGFTVIAVNFNVGSGSIAHQQPSGKDPVHRIEVPARFPLKDGDAATVVTRFKGIAKKATRFAVMNAVTDTDYKPLLDAATGKNGAYLKSYKATGGTSAVNMMSKKIHMENPQPNNFATMGDVYHADSMEE